MKKNMIHLSYNRQLLGWDLNQAPPKYELHILSLCQLAYCYLFFTHLHFKWFHVPDSGRITINTVYVVRKSVWFRKWHAVFGMNVQRGVKKSYEVGRSGKNGRRKEAGCSIPTGTMYITKEGGHCRQWKGTVVYRINVYSNGLFWQNC